MMNKTIVMFIMVFVMFILTGCNDKNTTTEVLNKEYYTKNKVLDESEEIIGPNTDNHIIFVYSPTCSHCHEVLTGLDYADFKANPLIRLYVINSYNASGEFLDKINVEYVPHMILVEIEDDEVVKVTHYEGLDDCIDLLKEFTD